MKQITRLAALLGAVVLSFLLGAWITAHHQFPYQPYLKNSFFGVESYLETSFWESTPKDSSFWYRTYFERKGVTRNKHPTGFSSFTFYCPQSGTEAYLINMNGEIVHRWEKSFRKAWPSPKHIQNPVNQNRISWTGCKLFENGDILAAYRADHSMPSAYGLVKLDKDSKIIWKYSGRVHHDLDVNERTGNIWTLTRKAVSLPAKIEKENPQLVGTIFEDQVVQLSSKGTERLRISILDAIVNSNFEFLLKDWGRRDVRSFDPLHANHIEQLDTDFTEHHEKLERNDLLVSVRDLDAFIAVDPTTEKVSWAQKGFWSKQHDPDPLESGHLRLFDNLGHIYKGGRSQIVEYDPQNFKIEWRYSGSAEHPFHSLLRGEQVELRNGNLLISESMRGRIFEINKQKEIVWEYIVPQRRKQNGNSYIPSIGFGVKRVSPKQLDFLKN